MNNPFGPLGDGEPAAFDLQPFPRPIYGWYVVAVLVLMNVLSTLDRLLLSLLVKPVRHDLAISDTQISLLQGLAFALFYAAFGLPLGWLADRVNRRNIIALGVVLWSLMTIACGLATTFAMLFAARIGVGVGEAALLPAAYSMIADYFPLDQRGRALSVFTVAQFAGLGVAWGVGGAVLLVMQSRMPVSLPLIGILAPWQLAFVVVGAAGFALCPLLMSVSEPARRGLGTKHARTGVGKSALLPYIMRHKSAFIPLYAVYALMAFVGYNFQSWLPTYFERRYHMPAAAAGVRIGLVITVFGTIGCILSGILGDRWSVAGRTGGRFRVTSIWWAAALVSTVGIFCASNATTALVFFALFNLGAAIALASAAASIQDIVPNELRGRATAVYLLLIGVVGFGMGPTAVALVTDYIFRDDLGLRYSLLVVPLPAIMLGAVCTVLALAPYQRLYEAINGDKRTPRQPLD
jgi:MFS family permease